MQSKASTVSKYLKELPPDRREAIEAVREVILQNLGEGFEEGMQYGMIGYYVPHSVYPPGYHCDPKQPLPFAGLASQKNYMSVYLMCVYGVPEHEAWFRKAWTSTGKKLDMGKGCVRFRKLEDVPLRVIGGAVKRVSSRRFIEHYESVRPGGPALTKGQDDGASSRTAAGMRALSTSTGKSASGGAAKSVAKKKKKKKKKKVASEKAGSRKPNAKKAGGKTARKKAPRRS